MDTTYAPRCGLMKSFIGIEQLIYSFENKNFRKLYGIIAYMHI